MGNFLGLTSSAGVVQKVLPKRHNRKTRLQCG